MNIQHTVDQELASSTPVTRRFTGRKLLAVLAILLLPVMATTAHASASDGKYLLESVSGRINVAGKSVSIGKRDVADFGVANSRGLVVENHRINIRSRQLKEVVRDLERELGAKASITISGPKQIVLQANDGGWVGESASPNVVGFSISASGRRISGEFRYRYLVNIDADGNAEVLVKVSGSIRNVGRISGNVKLTFSKQE